MSTFHWMRVLSCSVKPHESGNLYDLELVLVPTGDTFVGPPYTGDAFAALLGVIDPADGVFSLTFTGTGDAPPSGWYPEPAAGPLSVVEGSSPYATITTSAPIVVRIECAVTFSTAVDGTHSVTLRVLKNGSPIGSATSTTTIPGAHAWSDTPTIDLHDVELEAGDEITVDYTGTEVFWTNGPNAVFLRVGRGTHVWPPIPVTWVGP